jgi:N-acetylmuramoyl-L-alanine amidase
VTLRYHSALLFASLLLPQAAFGQVMSQATTQVTPSGAAPAAAPAGACNHAAFRVVVDVGHTLESPGAFSARGVTEYDFNLKLAKVIEQKLVADGFTKTLMLVTPGQTVRGLVARTRNANAAEGDVFLSVHHDSVPEQFKETWDFEGKQIKYSDRFSGHSLFVSFNNAERKASLLFGNLLGKEMKSRELKYTLHYTDPIMGSRQRDLVDVEAGVYRYDKLFVLRGATMPAVLLEAGMIINRNDETLLASPERQALIAASVSGAVEKFCDLRTAEKAKLMAESRRAKKKQAKDAKGAKETEKKKAGWFANPFTRSQQKPQPN